MSCWCATGALTAAFFAFALLFTDEMCVWDRCQAAVHLAAELCRSDDLADWKEEENTDKERREAF